MAALRRARRSPAAACKEQREASLINGAERWKITNLWQVLEAMAECAGSSPTRLSKRKRSSLK
jgi:hypothetical protein